jgi:predicted nucleotide-binding protein
MAEFTYIEKQRLEKLFGMGSGYVWRFSDKTFREFVHGTTGRNIEDEKYKTSGTSKANRLRTFWVKESDKIVGKLLNEMLQLVGDDDPQLRETETYQQCMAIAQRLVGKSVSAQNSKRISSEVPKTSSVERNVFVVYGRDVNAKRGIFQFLRAIGLNPIDFLRAVESTGKAAPYIGEVLEAAFKQAQAVLVLMTPDDEVQLREEFRTSEDEVFESQLTGQPRPNVIFEAGMALGLFPDRTVLVELGKIRPISDLSGRHVVRLNNSSQARQTLAKRLKQAGCSVDLDGVDWHDEGSFDVKVVPKKTELASDAIRKRIQEALEPPNRKWRTVERVAYSAGVSLEVATGILQSDERVRFSRGKNRDLIVGLRARVDSK